MPNIMTTQEEIFTLWQFIPDSVLLHIFSHLPTHVLLHASQVCKAWHRVAMDEYLWKNLFYHTWHIDTHIPMAPGKLSWLQEFKRLYFHTPKVESEVLCDHRDQVLHISFSHNGQLFATSSKDGYIKVWTATYPSHVKYYADMREFTWKYTQFSQFNETDTLLLVSGVHFGGHSTSGEIAVFNLVNGFELQSRVLNKPYDIFGTWYNETYLLSGNLSWLSHLTSCSVLWLNKASQALEAETESVVMRLYKFRNINASSIRTVMIAKCHDDDESSDTPSATPTTSTTFTATSTDSALFSDEASDLLDAVTPPRISTPPPVLASAVDASSPPPPPPLLQSPLPFTSSSSSACSFSPPSPPPPPPAEHAPGMPAEAPQGREANMSMKGAETSQSECRQGKLKRKDSNTKLWQKVQVMPDGDRGVQFLKVDDSNDDGEETIEYNMDYRRAEELNSNDIDSVTLCIETALQDVEMLEDFQLPAMDGEREAEAKRSGGAWALPLLHPAPTELASSLPQPSHAISSTSSRQSDPDIRAAPWADTGHCSSHNAISRSSSSSSTSSTSSNYSTSDVTCQAQSCETSNSGAVDSASVTSANSNDKPSAWIPRWLEWQHCMVLDSVVNNSSSNDHSSTVVNPSTTTPLRVKDEASAVLPTPQPPPIEATCSATPPQPLPSTSAGCRMSELDFTGTGDRYLIFTTGMKTYTPHQIGIKRIKSLEEAYTTEMKQSRNGLQLVDNDYAMWRDEFDTVDHLIELHGHIIGMCLSPDNRYLYVNSRPWPQGYEIDNPLYPPPIAQEIDIHVIDLTTMHEVGTMLRAHKAYTPNDECFFIFLDVCQEYVASGAEDKHGYLWDRHYGVCLNKFPHTDVVNSVAFNPQDPEMLITVSDDNSLKIWRSLNRELQVKGHITKVTTEP